MLSGDSISLPANRKNNSKTAKNSYFIRSIPSKTLLLERKFPILNAEVAKLNWKKKAHPTASHALGYSVPVFSACLKGFLTTTAQLRYVILSCQNSIDELRIPAKKKIVTMDFNPLTVVNLQTPCSIRAII